jgi:hypothetical protein
MMTTTQQADLQSPASEKMLNWQLRKLAGQLMLTQEHASDTSCPCEYSDEHEYCLVKHLIHIQSLAEETIAMTEDARLKDTLGGIAGAANDLRRAYEESPEDKRPYADISQFAREARKAIEPYLFRYKQLAQHSASVTDMKRMREYWDEHLEYNPLRTGRKDTDAGAFLSYQIEAAGDIIRELGKDIPDPAYIQEKVNRIKREINSHDWTDPLSEQERTRLRETKLLAEQLPTFDKRSQVLKDLIVSIVNRDPSAIGEATDKLTVSAALKQEEPRWCLPIRQVEKQLGKTSRELGIMQAKTKKLRELLDMPIQICRGQSEMFQTLDPWGSRCRNPVTGRWTTKENCPEIPDDAFTIEGKELTWAISPIGMRRYDFVYRVYEADELIPSHDPMTFQPNPKFPQELQPRLRERAAPRVQVERIAANLDPGLLLEDYHATDRGAPIIGPDKVVESGNGRAMAIIRASIDYPNVYSEYKQYLILIAPRYGLDPKVIQKMKAPVLVRERVTDVVRTDFVAEANATSSISRSTVEIARTDADLITAEMLYDLNVLENENIEDALRASRNRDFVNRFLAKLPPEEQAGLLDATGAINQDGIRRIVTAIFVKAFETADSGLVLAERWFESTEPDVKNIFNGIARALGPLTRAESLVAANQREPGLSIAQDLAEAITVYSKVRKLQMRVEDYLAQMPMFERELTDFQEKVMIALHDRCRSSKRIGDLLTTYANLVIDSPHPEQKALIEMEKPTKEMLWDEAMRRTEKETEPAPALFQNWCFPNNKEGEEKMKTELKADPLLTEIASQLCTGGICFAKGDRKSYLPPPKQTKIEYDADDYEIPNPQSVEIQSVKLYRGGDRTHVTDYTALEFVYFTPEYSYAREYAEVAQDGVIAVIEQSGKLLDLRGLPADIRTELNEPVDLGRVLGLPGEWMYSGDKYGIWYDFRLENNDIFAEQIREAGYDGIIWLEESRHRIHTAVALLPEVISPVISIIELKNASLELRRVCFARGDKTDRLPICSPSEAKALERCITKVKAKQPKYCEKEWHKPPEEMRKGCYNPWAICRASVGCRLGGMPKYEERIKS